MNVVAKLVSIVVLLTSTLMGQKAQPIWTQIFTNRTTTGVSANVKNIGQSSHMVYALLSNNGGACSRGATGFRFEGSYDNTNWIAFSSAAIPDTVGANFITLYANGTFPFVRLNLLVLGTNCAINAYYSGTTDYLNGFINTPSANGFIIRNGSSTGGSLAINGSYNAAALGRAVIYSLDIWVDPGMTDVTVQLVDDTTNSGCVTGAVLWEGTFPGYVNSEYLRNKVFQFSGTPYFKQTTPGNSLCLLWNMGDRLQFTSTYRMEQ